MHEAFDPAARRSSLGTSASAPVFLLILASVCSAASLRVNDTLNAFHIYGKAWVSVYGDGVTAPGADIGSDGIIDMLNNNMRIGGSLISNGKIALLENVQVAGDVNCRGDLSMVNSGNVFSKKVNVGGRIFLNGGNPSGNVFMDAIHVGGNEVRVAGAWAANTYSGTSLTGTVTPATPGRPANLRFGTNLAFPIPNMVLPETTVNYDGSRNCTTIPGVVFNMGMCGLGGSALDTVLAPGRYGDFVIADGNRLYLGPGLYQFRTLRLKSDNTRMIFLQGNSGGTRVLIHDEFHVEPGVFLIGPERRNDPAFNAGSVFIYANGPVVLGHDMELWATLAAPHSQVHIKSGVRLYGQVFAAGIKIENGYNGSAGRGKFLPLSLSSSRTLKYNVIHYRHPL